LFVFSIVRFNKLKKNVDKEIEMNHPLHDISDGADGLAELEDQPDPQDLLHPSFVEDTYPHFRAHAE
jgi:hypothetical protein